MLLLLVQFVDIMKSILSTIIIFNAICVKAAVIQNCTSNSCNLQTCANTATLCKQYCYTKNCNISCSSPAGCESYCEAGGCQKMSCDIPVSSSKQRKVCKQECNRNCPEMKCKGSRCHQVCKGDNCKIDCLPSLEGNAFNDTHCYPTCYGKGCEINIRSFHAEAGCYGGSCPIRFSKRTNGYVTCIPGNCSLICGKGTYCAFNGACPNCTGPIRVDDPFVSNNNDSKNNGRINGGQTIKWHFPSLMMVAYMFFALCY